MRAPSASHLGVLFVLSTSFSGCAAPRAPAEVPDATDTEAPVAAEHADARDVLADFLRASNLHDLDALAELFAPDAVWYRADVPVYRGRDELLVPLAYDAATHAQFELQNLVFRGPRVRCEVVERNDFFAALGIDALRQDVEFEIADGRIASLRSLEPTTVGPEERTLGRFLRWLSSSEPEAFQRLMTASRPEHAGEFVAHARAWVAAGRPD